MNDARTKNAQALEALFGSKGLAERLNNVRIGVVTSDSSFSLSSMFLANVLVDTLARLWPNIEFHGGDAAALCDRAKYAAASGGSPTVGLQVRWSPPYDLVVAVNTDPPAETQRVIRVGGDDWIAELGPAASCGDSPNPVGPAFAAALAASQVCLRIFAAEMKDAEVEPIENCTFDTREICGDMNLALHSLDLGNTTVFGVGAVTHGLTLMLEHWPESVVGALNLVDKDEYGTSNGQRYAFMTKEAIGSSKAISVRERLTAAHPHLIVNSHVQDMNVYCEQHGFEQPMQRAIAGLDSPEARRQVALKLPERTINMWTGGIRCGAGRYLPRNGGACLACSYLEEAISNQDEVGLLHKQLNLLPGAIRDLLDSARGLRDDEANKVSEHWKISPTELIGQPLRSILPVLCATERIQLIGQEDAADVPFAFASLAAGIAGFLMLLKDLNSDASSESWSQHVFKTPTPHMRRELHPRQECVRCKEVREASDIFS